MLKRYPHSAQVVLKPMTVGLDTGILGEDSSTAEIIKIRGRFENKSAFNNSYTAKFFTGKNTNFSLRALDDAKLIFNENSYNIIRALDLQTHVEIWLS